MAVIEIVCLVLHHDIFQSRFKLIKNYYQNVHDCVPRGGADLPEVVRYASQTIIYKPLQESAVLVILARAREKPLRHCAARPSNV